MGISTAMINPIPKSRLIIVPNPDAKAVPTDHDQPEDAPSDTNPKDSAMPPLNIARVYKVPATPTMKFPVERMVIIGSTVPLAFSRVKIHIIPPMNQDWAFCNAPSNPPAISALVNSIGLVEIGILP